MSQENTEKKVTENNEEQAKELISGHVDPSTEGVDQPEESVTGELDGKSETEVEVETEVKEVSEEIEPKVMAVNRPAMIWVNYFLFALGALTMGIFSIGGVIMAHINSVGASPLDRDHSIYLQRTFWFSFLWTLALSILFTVTIPAAMLGGALGGVTMIGAWIGFWVIGLWYVYRIIKGAVFYSREEHLYD